MPHTRTVRAIGRCSAWQADTEPHFPPLRANEERRCAPVPLAGTPVASPDTTTTVPTVGNDFFFLCRSSRDGTRHERDAAHADAPPARSTPNHHRARANGPSRRSGKCDANAEQTLDAMALRKRKSDAAGEQIAEARPKLRRQCL